MTPTHRFEDALIVLVSDATPQWEVQRITLSLGDSDILLGSRQRRQFIDSTGDEEKGALVVHQCRGRIRHIGGSCRSSLDQWCRKLLPRHLRDAHRCQCTAPADDTCLNCLNSLVRQHETRDIP